MPKQKTPAELEREIAEVLSRPPPTVVGVSPAGVEWVAYDPSHVIPMKERLATLWKKHPIAALEQARSTYEALRARVYRAQGLRRKLGRDGMSDDAYWELSDRLRDARKALRAAERKARQK
jgi:hypothetical protein